MKYVIINGSPRKKNTWKVVKQVKKSLNGEFEEVHLLKAKIPMCNGCFKCFIEGEDACPHYDAVNPIVEKLLNADGIIMTSPVYAMNISGLLKNFLDHTAYFYHRPAFFTKKALVIVTTAGAGHKDAAKYLDETLRHWGVNKVHKLSLACGGAETLDTKPIDKVAGEFGKDVESQKLHSPKLMDIIFYNAWRTMIVNEDLTPTDIRYWHENGLVDNAFSPEVNLGAFKKTIGKLMFAVLKRVM